MDFPSDRKESNAERAEGCDVAGVERSRSTAELRSSFDDSETSDAITADEFDAAPSSMVKEMIQRRATTMMGWRLSWKDRPNNGQTCSLFVPGVLNLSQPT